MQLSPRVSIESVKRKECRLLDIGNALLVRHRAVYSFVCVTREKSVDNKNLQCCLFHKLTIAIPELRASAHQQKCASIFWVTFFFDVAIRHECSF
jgi:hypothetical protein